MFWQRKPDERHVVQVLDRIMVPAENRSLAATGWISGVVAEDHTVIVTLDIDPARRDELEPVRQDAERQLLALRGVKNAQVILTAERKPQPAGTPISSSIKPVEPQREVAPDVKHIIAVASGKGGVGKSTMAVNLAVSFQQMGLRTGLLDADVYGPSVPMLLNLRQAKPDQRDGYLIPLEAHGLKVMSMGFMVPEESPMVWRGPMVQSALLQMLRDVKWGALDVLVIDMPPGTGDTQLTIAQRVKLAGAVIVSTPQDIALLDTVKGVEMFQKVSVPILGVIENMSLFVCPHCHQSSPIFGEHGARHRAAALGVPFLGEIPLDMGIREKSDKGEPIALNKAHQASRLFADIAQQVWSNISVGAGRKPAPRIIIEEADA